MSIILSAEWAVTEFAQFIIPYPNPTSNGVNQPGKLPLVWQQLHCLDTKTRRMVLRSLPRSFLSLALKRLEKNGNYFRSFLIPCNTLPGNKRKRNDFIENMIIAICKRQGSRLSWFFNSFFPAFLSSLLYMVYGLLRTAIFARTAMLIKSFLQALDSFG